MASGNYLSHLDPKGLEPISGQAFLSAHAALTGTRFHVKFATNQYGIWSFTVPDSYDGSGNLVVEFEGEMDAANTGTKVVDMRAAFERATGTGKMDGTGGAIDFGGTEQAATVTVNNTSFSRFAGTITLTNAQAAGIQPGERVRLKLRRVSTNDTATGNFLMTGGDVKQA